VHDGSHCSRGRAADLADPVALATADVLPLLLMSTRVYAEGGLMTATIISLVCSGFVAVASDYSGRRPIDNVLLTIDLRARRVSGFAKGTIEDSSTSGEIGWIDHECPHPAAMGSFDRITGKTRAGVCAEVAGDRDRRRLVYYEMTCVPSH
jgi:hypothetical protein